MVEINTAMLSFTFLIITRDCFSFPGLFDLFLVTVHLYCPPVRHNLQVSGDC